MASSYAARRKPGKGKSRAKRDVPRKHAGQIGADYWKIEAEARVLYERALASQAEKGKGGRPKKGTPSPRDFDLESLMATENLDLAEEFAG